MLDFGCKITKNPRNPCHPWQKIRTFAHRMTQLAVYFPITDPTLIFFVVLLMILFAPIIMSKLRIPHIIGLVLAGVLIGQYGLNILQRDSSFDHFPETVDVVGTSGIEGVHLIQSLVDIPFKGFA